MRERKKKRKVREKRRIFYANGHSGVSFHSFFDTFPFKGWNKERKIEQREREGERREPSLQRIG